MKGLAVMSCLDIIDQYKKGRRDFRNIMCTSVDFMNADLSGADFSGSNLSFNSFSGANLTGTNFGKADVQWSNFEHAKMTRTNMAGANARWCKFNDAVFEKVNMRGADISWSIFFNVPLYAAADLTNAVHDVIALHPSEITSEGLERAREEIKKLGVKLDFETWYEIKLSVSGTTRTSGIDIENPNKKSPYATDVSVDGGNYSVSKPENASVLYSPGNKYQATFRYKTKSNYEK